MRRVVPAVIVLVVAGLGLALWLREHDLPGESVPPRPLNQAEPFLSLWWHSIFPETQAPPRPPNLSRFDAAFESQLAQISSVPAFREQLAGLPRRELRQAIQSLAAKGMRRLSDERLEARTRIVGRMLEGLDVETCSAMATGRQNEAVHDAAVLVLDPDSVETWVTLSFEAARAELEKTPASRPSQQELQLALSLLFRRVPEADSERLRSDLAALGDQPPAEACWAARTTYATVPALPAPVARVLARELAGP